MKVAALKALLDTAGDDQEPAPPVVKAALEEAFDIVIGIATNIARIADAMATIAEAVDDNCQPALVVKALIEPAPPADPED